MEYYVTTPNGEKGPYEEETIRGWVRDGTIPRDTPVRRANEMGSLPASFVFPNEVPELPSTNTLSDDFENPYAAPKVISLPSTAVGEAIVEEPGSFGSGVVFGLFCGCVAYFWSLASDSIGYETKYGVKVGFAVHVVLGLIFRIVKEVLRAILNP